MRIEPRVARSGLERRDWHHIAAIAFVAFVLRLIVGLWRGPDFIDEGYAFYAEIARTFLSGGGLCYTPGHDCAIRMPLYPITIAPFLATGTAYPGLIVLQAAISASTAVWTFLIGSDLFGKRAGLLAALATTLNPYMIVHASAFQDTALVNALTAGSVWLLIRSWRTGTVAAALGAGVLLGLVVLTSARMLPFALAAAGWVILTHRARRFAVTTSFLLALVVVLGGWVIRNVAVVGAPVLTTESGVSLWLANNDVVMDVLPNRSIDEVGELATAALPQADQARLESISDDVLLDRELGRMGLKFAVSRPWITLRNAALKVAYQFVGWLSPRHDWPVQLGYLAIFLPINLLAFAGAWRARRGTPANTLLLLVFASFIATTAVFWAHTSHRSMLHAFLFIYAAHAVDMWLDDGARVNAARTAR